MAKITKSGVEADKSDVEAEIAGVLAVWKAEEKKLHKIIRKQSNRIKLLLRRIRNLKRWSNEGNGPRGEWELINGNEVHTVDN